MGFHDILRKFLRYFKRKKEKRPELLEIPEISEVQKQKKPTRYVNDNIITKRIQGINFIFDKESSKEFASFVTPNHTMIVKNGYLARQHKREGGYITFFHIWLMSKEIDEFKKNYGGNVEVDHLLGKQDNRKPYLRVISERDHKRKHGREREYWEKIEKKRKELKESLK